DEAVGEDAGDGELAVPDARPVRGDAGRGADEDDAAALAGEGERITDRAGGADGVVDQRWPAFDEARRERWLEGARAGQRRGPVVGLLAAAEDEVRACAFGELELEAVAAEHGNGSGPAGEAQGLDGERADGAGADD